VERERPYPKKNPKNSGARQHTAAENIYLWSPRRRNNCQHQLGDENMLHFSEDYWI